MENGNIIIILLVIIVILLAAVLGVMLLNPSTAKEPTKLKITSDNEQYDDGELSIQLTDLNDSSIPKQIVNITITNGNGEVVVDEVVKTDSNGKASLNFDLNKGDYNVHVSYSGNQNFTGNKTTQKLTIKEAVVETEAGYSSQSQTSSGNQYSLNNLPPSNDPYPETSREQTDEHTVMQKYEDGYISYVDLRTGERTSGGYYK